MLAANEVAMSRTQAETTYQLFVVNEQIAVQMVMVCT